VSVYFNPLNYIKEAYKFAKINNNFLVMHELEIWAPLKYMSDISDNEVDRKRRKRN